MNYNLQDEILLPKKRIKSTRIGSVNNALLLEEYYQDTESGTRHDDHDKNKNRQRKDLLMLLLQPVLLKATSSALRPTLKSTFPQFHSPQDTDFPY